MEGGFFDDLRQLEFFPGAQDVKQGSTCLPVVSTSLANQPDHLCQGLYQDEKSVDFSSIIDAVYNTATVPNSSAVPAVATVVSPRNSPATQDTAANSNFHSFSGFADLSALAHHHSMFDAENYGTSMHGGQVEMTPSPPAMAVDCIGVPPTPSPHVVQIDTGMAPINHFTALRPAPGKAQKSGKADKKLYFDKNTMEYRQKRDRNNVAVRKSREKSKVRVMGTEKRVKELEEENTHLQSKIALLSKELNVLKSLFTSAGVSQPPSFHAKDQRRAQK